MYNDDLVCEEVLKYGNPIAEKSFNFSVRIVKCFKELSKRDSSLLSLYNQLLRSGTSIGANVAEAQHSPSKKDFIHKLNISLKEAQETSYWLRLLNKIEVLNQSEYLSIQEDCIEIIKLLTSIIKKAKINN